LKKKTLLKIGLALLLLAAGVALYLSPLRSWFTEESLRRTRLTLIEFGHHWYAPFVFIAAYAVGCVFAIPATIYIIAAAVLFGWKLGGLYAVIGGSIGAYACFELGKFFGGDVLHRLGERGRRVATHLHHAGFKSLLIMRLIPIFPFVMLNYGAGLAGIKSRDFIFATVIGLAPSTFVVAYSADLLLTGDRHLVAQRLIIVLALVLAVVVIPMLFKRKAQNSLHLDETEP
jgi:uncharacterized membrane protein YdjX (TVP38/TMEM64 family)